MPIIFPEKNTKNCLRGLGTAPKTPAKHPKGTVEEPTLTHFSPGLDGFINPFFVTFFVYIFQYCLLKTFTFCVVEARIWSTEFVNILKRKVKKSWFSLDHVRDPSCHDLSLPTSNTLNHWKLLNVALNVWPEQVDRSTAAFGCPLFPKCKVLRPSKCMNRCLCRCGSFWLLGVTSQTQA